MDPLSALSLVGNIVQFVDFGSRLFSDARELYKSSTGTLEVNLQLELMTSDLRAFVVKLQQQPPSKFFGPLTQEDIKNDKEFANLCEQAGNVAEELISHLDSLKCDGRKHKIWKSLQLTVRSAWKQDQVEVLKKRLSAFKEALQNRLILSIRQSLDTQALCVSDSFDALDKQTQLIISSLLDTRHSIQNMSRELQIQTADQTLALTQLLSRLTIINKDEQTTIRETIIGTNCKGKGSPKVHIAAGIEMLAVSDEKESKLRNDIQNRIAESLWYPSMQIRYEDVVEAHPNTFNWIFTDPTVEQLPWSNFSSWLETGKGIYWVNGKAGSGKSTLMKHIFDDDWTRDYLKTWANEDPFCLVTFFFWNSGTLEQRSQTGLLRSILFQILKTYPLLTPTIMPHIWATTYSQFLKQDQIPPPSTDYWSRRMLIAAFKRFAEQREIPLKTCLLIDGLDEFAGDHEEILSLFKEIAHSENVKICLSSRPWPIFREAFKLCPTLRLQDLTFPDIDKFVREKLQQNELFNKIKAEEPKDAEALMEETVSKADGVFVWVRIVIRSLSEGMVNRDSIHELLARLRELPTEIELLYEHLLGLIKPMYLQWTCKVVQIVQLVYRLSGCHPSPSIGLRGLYFAINDNIDFDKVLKLSPDSLARKCEDTEIHLAARGAGLLEVGYSQYHDRGSIKWFHRTARDFVEQNWDRLNIVTKTSNAAFRPNLAMMKSNILELCVK